MAMLPVPTINPMLLLGARAQQNSNAAQGEAGFAPPLPAPVAAAPATGPAAGGGGIFSNVGSRLAQAISGDRGVFASAPDAARDEQIDPLTGASQGVSRRANNQAIMKMGVMLMAAGMRQSDDSRAQILSGLGGAMDTSSSINNFARNRLEMAKLKLIEREQAQQMAMNGAAASAFGINLPGATSPVAGGAVDPASSASALGAPAPGAVQQAPLAPMGGQTAMTTAPAGGGVSMTAPAQGQAPVIPVSQLPTTAPAAPSGTGYVPTEDDRRAAAMMPASELGKFYTDRQAAWNDQEITTDPYNRAGVGVVVDVYKAGRKIRTERIGDAQENAVVQLQPDGSTRVLMQRPDGTLASVEEIRDPVRDRREIMNAEEGQVRAGEGQQVRRDANGNVTIENVPGGVAQAAIDDAARARAEKERNAENVGGVVIGALDRSFGILQDDSSWLPATGMSAALTQYAPGTPAHQVRQNLLTVRANIGFDRLQAMREASPTGGALGSVTEGEIARLEATMGNLEQAQRPEDLAYNLAYIRNQIMETIHGAEGAAENGYLVDLSQMAGAPRQPNLPGLGVRPSAPAAAPATTPEGYPEKNPDGSPGYIDLGNGIRMRRVR